MGLQTAQTRPMCYVAKVTLPSSLHLAHQVLGLQASTTMPSHHLKPLIALTLSAGSSEKTDFFLTNLGREPKV